MKNYKNFILENINSDDVIREIIQRCYLSSLNVIKDKLPEFLEEHFTSLPVKNVKETMKMYNIKNDKITKVYTLLDDLFSRFEKIEDDNSIKFKLNNKVYAEFKKSDKKFYYDFTTIYVKLFEIMNYTYNQKNENIIIEIVRNMVDYYFDLGLIIPRKVFSKYWK